MGIEISDVVGLSQPITKLIEVTSAGLGKSTEAFFRVRNAKAFAKELEVVTKAFEKHGKIIGNIKFSREDIELVSQETGLDLEQAENYAQLIQRSSNTDFTRSIKKQVNTESVLSHAAEELKDDDNVPDKEIDEDWLSLYFSIIENVSSDYMHSLWGKVLAGEIRSPEGFSLRTLEVLKTMSVDEAELFSKIARKAAFLSEGVFIVEKKFWQSFYAGLVFKDYNILEQIGLVQSLSYNFNALKVGDKIVFDNSDRFLVGVEFEEEAPSFSINYTSLTKTGQDIFSLIQDKDGSIKNLIDFMECINIPHKHKKFKGEYTYKAVGDNRASLTYIENWK